jgi:hypothetical protein
VRLAASTVVICATGGLLIAVAVPIANAASPSPKEQYREMLTASVGSARHVGGAVLLCDDERIDLRREGNHWVAAGTLRSGGTWFAVDRTEFTTFDSQRRSALQRKLLRLNGLADKQGMFRATGESLAYRVFPRSAALIDRVRRVDARVVFSGDYNFEDQHHPNAFVAVAQGGLLRRFSLFGLPFCRQLYRRPAPITWDRQRFVSEDRLMQLGYWELGLPLNYIQQRINLEARAGDKRIGRLSDQRWRRMIRSAVLPKRRDGIKPAGTAIVESNHRIGRHRSKAVVSAWNPLRSVQKRLVLKTNCRRVHLLRGEVLVHRAQP